MKKFLLFALVAMTGLPMMAQDEIGADVTKYVANAGFDEDLTWQANGDTKPIVSQTEVLSNRSYAYVAEDNSVYCYGRGKRSDGASPAWNGFIGQVKGWTIETNKSTSAPFAKSSPEWVYFGTVPYDLGEKAVPIADDGTTFLAVPERPAAVEGDNVGFAYLRAGWGGRAVYKQEVKLPAAKYLLEYWAININPNASNGTNLSKVTCRKDVWADETGFNDTEWTKHEIEFEALDKFTIEFGFESNEGSGSNPFLCIDGIKLTKIDDVDPLQLVESDCYDALYDLAELEGSLSDYSGLAKEFADESFDLEMMIGDALTVEAMQEVLAKINAAIEKYKKAIEDVQALEALITEAEEIARDTDYPGKDDLNKAISDSYDVVSNGNAAAIEQCLVDLKKAVFNYYTSQEASFENPADFTFAVQSPWFVAKSGQPTVEADGSLTFPNEYDEEHPYATGSAPFDGSSDGWYKYGTETGGDQRLNWQQGRTCWNAWANNFTGTIGIAQDIVDLPNGFYKVSADLITQEGYCTDQHTFAKGTLGNANSPALVNDTWVDNGYGLWETLTTTDAVIVADGKLTIGAVGTGSGVNAAGWFLVTNFKLLYCGPATDEQIAEALAARVAEVTKTIEDMHFAADKAEAQKVLAEYNETKDLEKLTEAAEKAETSEAKYTEIMAEGKTIPTLEAGLADGSYNTAAEIAKFALDYVKAYIASPEATYTEVDGKIAEVKVYTETYIPVYLEAEKMVGTVKSELSKQVLESEMNGQKALLTSELKDAETVAGYVEYLQTLMYNVNKQERYANNPDATDYTSFIQNPMAEAETGWKFEKGTGNTNTNGGQWYTGDTSVRYFDSWNGTQGALNYYAEQVVLGLPNGTYTVGADVRTSGEGAFIFAGDGGEAKSDTTWVEIPLQTYTHISDETGEEVTDNATDKWGKIWEDACERFASMTDSDPDYFDLLAITNANNGQGHGWMHLEIPAIVVKDHKLVIGMTTDVARSGKEFTGTWFSVGNWTLTLTANGDNEGWGGPLATGIHEVNNAQETVVDGIYTISGARVNSLQRGLNIVVRNGKAMKVLVK